MKIGWPGVIVLEGDADRVEAYVGAIQGWRFCSHHSKMVDSATLDAMQVCTCALWSTSLLSGYTLGLPSLVLYVGLRWLDSGH